MIRWLMTLTALGCGGSDGADDASDKPEAPCAGSDQAMMTGPKSAADRALV